MLFDGQPADIPAFQSGNPDDRIRAFVPGTQDFVRLSRSFPDESAFRLRRTSAQAEPDRILFRDTAVEQHDGTQVLRRVDPGHDGGLSHRLHDRRKLPVRKPVGDAQQGSLTRDVTVYQGDNTFELDVTSGGSTVSYKVAVTGTDSVYASDLAWESATSGDPNTNPVRKDKSCGNNTITLWNGEKEQTFDKGIGTHAASRIVYDVSDLGASRFEAYVGVDRELTGVDRDHANVDFQVMIDGEVVFEKTAMQHDTPMAKVSVDIPEGAKTITLAVGAGSETWGDHADWADARFVGVEMPEAPQVTGLAVTGERVKDGKLDMTVGQSVGLGVTVTPEDAVDQSVTWTVAGDAVSVGEDGTVKALKAGTATVTVASVAVPSVTASVTVTVTEKADPDPDPKPDPDPDPDPTPKPDPDPDPNPNPGPGDEPGTTTPGDGQKPNTDKDADKNAGKDKNQSIAATGASIVPVGVLAVSMMAAGCALTWRKRRES